jgi:hypothetical protein
MTKYTFVGQRELPVRLNLPSSMLREIGRAMVTHALLEWLLLRTIYLLLALDPIEGRIAVRDPRTTDRLDMIVDLLRIKKATKKVTVDLQDLRTRLDECSRARDALAHGIWVRDDEASKWFLRFSGGSWQPPGEKEK